MKNKKKILAISGSTRKNSTNHRLIRAIAELSKEILDIELYNHLADLPQFNPDNDNENVSIEVTHFRQLLHAADGVIICTPEYAHGVPGSLKNAIDWTVGTGEFSHKPTILITASTDGKYGHNALLETLNVIEAKNVQHLQLVISFASTKINTDNKITNEKTLKDIQQLIADFEKTIDDNLM
jgi:chromate reductase, NAD(P)H dehydrogenase (quinone)